MHVLIEWLLIANFGLVQKKMEKGKVQELLRKS
jgi:hypothetical protein